MYIKNTVSEFFANIAKHISEFILTPKPERDKIQHVAISTIYMYILNLIGVVTGVIISFYFSFSAEKQKS